MKKILVIILLIGAGALRAEETSTSQTLSQILNDLMEVAKKAISVPGQVGDIKDAALNIKDVVPCLKSMNGECVSRCTNRETCAAYALNDAARILRPALQVLLGTVEIKLVDGKSTQSYKPGVLGAFLTILNRVITLISAKLQSQLTVGPHAKQLSEKLNLLLTKFATLVSALNVSVDALQALSVQLAPNAGLPAGPGTMKLPPVQLAS